MLDHRLKEQLASADSEQWIGIVHSLLSRARCDRGEVASLFGTLEDAQHLLTPYMQSIERAGRFRVSGADHRVSLTIFFPLYKAHSFRFSFKHGEYFVLLGDLMKLFSGMRAPSATTIEHGDIEYSFSHTPESSVIQSITGISTGDKPTSKICELSFHLRDQKPPSSELSGE